MKKVGTRSKNVSNRKANVSASQARRMALSCLGFSSSGGEPGFLSGEKVRSAGAPASTDEGNSEPKKPAGWRTLNRCINTMSVLQIDAVNTVIRSHYMPLYSRLGAYDRGLFDKKLFAESEQKPNRRIAFEYWGHECSLLPLAMYPLFKWRMDNARKGKGIYRQLSELARNDRKYVNSVKALITECGPTTCRELGAGGRGAGMWEWSKSKQALEYLFATGDLSSSGRRGFQRVYELTERAIPGDMLNDTRMCDVDARKQLLVIAAKALGIATEADLRDYFRLSAAESSDCVKELVEDGALEICQVENWSDTAYVSPGIKVPRKINASSFLTPFDPVVWNRNRARRLFDFDYKIEIYVPAAKRKYGYYVMPFLLGERLVARVDLKADRDKNCLSVLGLWFESEIAPVTVMWAIAKQLAELSRWLELGSTEVVSQFAGSKELRKVVGEQYR